MPVPACVDEPGRMTRATRPAPSRGPSPASPVQAATGPAVVQGDRHGWLVRFPPGYFAFVMATGIVSLAAYLQEVPLVPAALFALNLVAYPALLAITLARLLRHPSALLCDLADHAA